MEGKKHRMYQFTLNEIEKWDKLFEYLNSFESLGYLIAGKEKAPSTGHEHIHCFVQFKVPIKISIKKICGAHVEVCRGTPQDTKNPISTDFGKTW